MATTRVRITAKRVEILHPSGRKWTTTIPADKTSDDGLGEWLSLQIPGRTWSGWKNAGEITAEHDHSPAVLDTIRERFQPMSVTITVKPPKDTPASGDESDGTPT